MVRQCAWCLRLIDDAGERISPLPLPKLYEVSHGMCTTCGALWLEQVLSSRHVPGSALPDPDEAGDACTHTLPERPEIAPPTVVLRIFEMLE